VVQTSVVKEFAAIARQYARSRNVRQDVDRDPLG
jgi:hypothetical protein